MSSEPSKGGSTDSRNDDQPKKQPSSKEIHDFMMEREELGKSSFFLFSTDNALRKACIKVAQNYYFDQFILFIILFNCITMAMDNAPDPESSIGKFLRISDDIFVYIFTFESLVKSICYGLYFNGPTSYLRSGWNRLDFLVVVFGLTSIILNTSGSLSFLRSARVIRVIRGMNRIPGLKLLVSAVIGSLPDLLDVMGLLAIILFMFGLAGMQFFAGGFRNRCYESETGFELESYCGDDDDCGTGEYCADSGYNPDYGTVGFDNIVLAWLTIFRCLTLEGWSDIM